MPGRGRGRSCKGAGDGVVLSHRRGSAGRAAEAIRGAAFAVDGVGVVSAVDAGGGARIMMRGLFDEPATLRSAVEVGRVLGVHVGGEREGSQDGAKQQSGTRWLAG